MSDNKTYEEGQKHPSGLTGKDAPPDTSANSVTDPEGRRVGLGSTVYEPGVGFFVSNGGFSKKSRTRQYKEKRSNASDTGMFFAEDEVIQMADAVRARRAMDGAKSARRLQFEKDKVQKHIGTDAYDNAKSELPCAQTDDFDVDKSRSTIFIGVSNIGPPGMALNGSKIMHRQAVLIYITNPDGRRICEVMMSLEQFAAALVTNSHTPCTLSAYWSIDESNVWLKERVRPPQSVYKRMKQRMATRTAEQKDLADKLVAELEGMADAGKTARKTKLMEIAERVARMSSHFESNNAFAVKQAKEEISGIMESAAIQFIGQQVLADKQALFDAAGPALEMDEEDEEV